MAGEEEEALACRECQTTGYLFLVFSYTTTKIGWREESYPVTSHSPRSRIIAHHVTAKNFNIWQKFKLKKKKKIPEISNLIFLPPLKLLNNQ
jgi:hypothetical protein